MSRATLVSQLCSLVVAPMLLLACAGKDAAPAADSSAAQAAAPSASAAADAELTDVAQYRLTMDKVDQYMAAQRNLATKAAALSPAERAAIEARSQGRDNQNASIDDMVRTIEGEPVMVAAIREAGLTPREFTLITMSMMQSGMAAAVVKMRPNDNRDSLVRAMSASPENVKFMIDNEAELNRRQQEIEAALKRLQPSDSSDS